MFDATLTRLRRKRSQPALSHWQVAAISSAIAAGAVTGVHLLWRLVAGTSDASSADKLAATTAAAVAEAARQAVIDTADGSVQDLAAAVREAAREAVAEAASAGADITAAAFGVLRGARQVAASSGPAVVEAAVAGMREAATGIGAPARERIDLLIESLE